MAIRTREFRAHPDLAQWFDNAPTHGSRVSKNVYGGCVFVSSENDCWGGTRRYTIRVVTMDYEQRTLDIDNVCPYGYFGSRDSAHRLARRFARAVQDILPDYPTRSTVNRALQVIDRTDWQYPDDLL